MDKVMMNDSEMDAVTGGTMIPYQVKSGDTLNDIAKQFNVSLVQLMKWNNIQDPNLLVVGQTLKVKF